MTNGNSLIQLKGIGKRFGSRWILFRLDLSVRRGESIALFGKNGSGKTTLLRMLATLLPPTTGDLRLMGGTVPGREREIRRKIRFLGHEKQLYGSLTVMENLRLAYGIRGLDRQEEKSIDPILEELGLAPFRNQRLGHLSEGMKKRVVLARLLIGIPEAELILLDEPYPTLDTKGRKILNALIETWRKTGKTILLASHDHTQALAHADRLLILDDGLPVLPEQFAS